MPGMVGGGGEGIGEGATSEEVEGGFKFAPKNWLEMFHCLKNDTAKQVTIS